MGFLAFVLSIVATTIWFNRKTSLLVISGILVILSIVEVVKCGFKYKKANGSPASTLQNDTSIMKKIGMIFLGGILGFAVVQGHLWIRGGDMLDYFRENEQKIEYRCIEDNENGEKTMSKCKISNLQTLRESPKWEKFNGFVQVIDAQKWHTYLVKDEYEKVWRLSSEQNYHLGDQIFLSASLLRRDESKVFDGTIFSPLGAEFWQYSFNYDKWLFMKGIDGTAYEKASLMVDLNQELESQTVMGTHSMEKKLGFVDNVRANLQKYVESIYGQNQYAGLLLGLLHRSGAIILHRMPDKKD
ncbi:hypothetical protein AGMMS50249_8160 [candidate division SR1 bacterium]|nr:hypothetical protein AGMMS50249_8160 [candidate division SR1 bacterium]